eukprot:COSAG06_NODE_4537_length_4166_cov_34.424391_5_plen_98_part_00
MAFPLVGGPLDAPQKTIVAPLGHGGSGGNGDVSTEGGSTLETHSSNKQETPAAVRAGNPLAEAVAALYERCPDVLRKAWASERRVVCHAKPTGAEPI